MRPLTLLTGTERSPKDCQLPSSLLASASTRSVAPMSGCLPAPGRASPKTAAEISGASGCTGVVGSLTSSRSRVQSTRNLALDRAGVAAQRVGGFFDAESFDVPENDCGAHTGRHLAECLEQFLALRVAHDIGQSPRSLCVSISRAPGFSSRSTSASFRSGPTWMSRYTRFIATFDSGTRWKKCRGAMPEASRHTATARSGEQVLGTNRAVHRHPCRRAGPAVAVGARAPGRSYGDSGAAYCGAGSNASARCAKPSKMRASPASDRTRTPRPSPHPRQVRRCSP
jgi:hypothetical protein